MISYLRKALPASYKRSIKHALEVIGAITPQIFAKKNWLANFYYCVFSRRFDREHYAVLKGRQAYFKQLNELRESSPLLRRNIHRLEKGLIMEPRRNIFAQDYILETVLCFDKVLTRQDFSKDEIRWAKDVLDEYFSIVEDTPVIVKARKIYDSKKNHENQADQNPAVFFKPYKLNNCPETDISFDQLVTLFQQRRSVRWYKSIPVPLEKIQKAINAAALAPSACNRQPYRFIVTTDPDQATKIADCAGGTGGWSHQIPAIIVVIGDLSAYPKERDRHLIYIDASLAAMQLMLAAQTQGLSTCSINWPDVDYSEIKLRKILALAEYERVVMMISIGIGDPNGGIPYSQKKHHALIMQEFFKE